jgi:hypothetical protein
MLLPCPTNVPPQEPEYQLKTALLPSEPPDCVRVTGDPWQIVVGGPTVTAEGAVDAEFTTTAEVVLAHAVVVAHGPDDTILRT